MRNKYFSLLIYSNLLIFLDQATKYMVASHIPLHYSMRIVEGFFSLTHIRNSGVAFGLFARSEVEYKAYFFVAISLIAIGAILVFFHQTPSSKKPVLCGLILIFSGAIGNLIDRVVYKEVIDFLDFFYQNHHWPAFNIADSCITIGVGFMIYDLFHQEKPQDSISPSEN